ncbi:MAG: ATP-binding protein [Mariniphaga sp.]
MKASVILLQKIKAILNENPSKSLSQLSKADNKKLIHELEITINELVYQHAEKASRASELIIANEELAYQNHEKASRASELIIANEELAYQNHEKENRAAELIIANENLVYHSNEKDKRAAELLILTSKLDLQTQLVNANKLVAFQYEQLKHIASLLPGVIYQYRLRPDGTSCFPYASEALSKIFRVKPEDVLEDGSKVWNNIHPDDIDKVIASARLSAKNLTPWEQEYRLKFDDGTVRTIFANSTPQGETDGSVLSYGYAVDITEYKIAEENRKLNREILQIMSEPENLSGSIRHIISTLKTRMGFDAVGIRLKEGDDYPYYDHIGLSEDFLKTENSLVSSIQNGLKWKEKNGNILLECLCGQVVSGNSDTMNLKFTEKGSFCTNDLLSLPGKLAEKNSHINLRNQCILQGFASVALVPIRDREKIIGLIQLNDRGKGRFTPELIAQLEVIAIHLAGLIKRKQIEAELEESNHLLLSFINHAPILTYIKEVTLTENRVLKASPNFFKLTGLQSSEIVGKNMFELFPAELASSIQIDDQKVISTGKVHKFEEILNGVTYESTKFLINSGSKKLIAGFSLDITERKLRELEIAHKNEELIKINAEKDKFFSIIAHDLRGPFSGFLGLTEMLAEKSNGMSKDTTQQIAVLMKDSAASLFQLLGNLLEWSKMQRGLIVFEPVSSLLMNEIIEILPLIVTAAEKKSIAIRYQIDNDLTIFADIDMLAAIFRNLVSNAVKFTPKGGTITISAKSESNKWVEIEVNDTGVGMSEKTVNNLFTLDINTNRKGTEGEQSSGLGLLICKDFIEKHNGILSITSEVNKGSTFSFTMPVKPKDLTIN